MATLSISLLGSFLVNSGGQPVSGFKSDKVRALLAYLAVEADRPHRREILSALLWPEIPDRSARSNLRDALSNLRQVIGDREVDPPYLLIERDQVQFNTFSDFWLDVAQFRALVMGDQDVKSNYGKLEEATALYRGGFLEGFSLKDSAAFEEWSLLTQEHLQRQAVMALSQIASIQEAIGDCASASDALRRQIELEPWEENAHQQLIRLLALDGQRAAAINHYENFKDSLIAELDVEPNEETHQLVERIRDGTLPTSIEIQTPAVHLERVSRRVGECPYRGLAAFREQDAHHFFGREDFSEKLFEAVHLHPLVTVILGPSGSGKSSVVAAGLLPRLRKEGNWLIAAFRPGSQPFRSMADVLLPLLEPDLSETDRLLETHKLSQGFYNSEVELYQVVGRILQTQAGEKRLLLVADQFEELYSLCSDQDTRLRLVDSLLTAVESGRREKQSSMVILLSLRADFMGQALSHRPFADALQDVSMMLGPMMRQELQVAIEQPAHQQGASFEHGLVNRILDDVGEEPGKLPLLEFALLLLWEQMDSGWLTHDAYDAIGGVDGALTRYAEEVYTSLDESQKGAARQVFLQLIRPGEGTEDSRRIGTQEEIGDLNWPLTQHLADCRLVVTGLDSDGIQTVELVHEALIRGWERLQSWLEADRAFRTWQEGLRVALRQWEHSDHDEGALLRGVPLTQSENWQTERQTELSPAETEYIQSSVNLRESRRLARERRRQRMILALVGGLVIAILVAIFAINLSRTAQREADVNHSLVLAASAQQAQENGEGDLALSLALQAVDMEEPPQEAIRVLSDIGLGPGTRALFPGHSSAVQAVALSPNSNTALTGSCGEFDSDNRCVQGEMKLWDLSEIENPAWEPGVVLQNLIGHEGQINSLAFSPDDQHVLSGSEDGTLILWNVETGDVLRVFQGHTGAVNRLVISPDGSSALSGSDDTTLILWDMETGEPIRRFEGHTSGVTSIAVSPDSLSALSGSEDATIIHWHLTTGEEIRRFEGHINQITGLAFISDGSMLLSSADHSLRLWDLETGQELRQQHFGGMPHLYAISEDGRTAIMDLGGLRLWDLEDWREYQWILAGDSAYVEQKSAALSPDGRLGLSGLSDGRLRLWNLGNQARYSYFDTDGTPLSAVAISKNGNNLLTGDMADVTLLWDIEHGEIIQRMQGQAVAVSPNSMAFSPDGKYALVGSGDAFGGSGVKSLVLYDLELGKEIRRFKGHQFVLRSVAISPDGRTALAGAQSQTSEEGELILWDLETGNQIRRFDTNQDISSVVFSQDGKQALTGSAYFSNVTLWDVSTGQPIRQFEGHTNMVFDVAFGPDEKTALSASADGSLILWDIVTGEIIRRYLGHDDMVWSLDLSPDGHHIISGSGDNSLILWDFETGEQLQRLRGHGELVPGVVFSPNGQMAYSVSLDGALIGWQISHPTLDELVDWIQTNRYVRDLTCDERVQYRVEPRCSVSTNP